MRRTSYNYYVSNVMPSWWDKRLKDSDRWIDFDHDGNATVTHGYWDEMQEAYKTMRTHVVINNVVLE